MNMKEISQENSERYEGKFVHYEEKGIPKIGKVLAYDSEKDRYIIQPNIPQHSGENFFILGEKLRKMEITEK